MDIDAPEPEAPPNGGHAGAILPLPILFLKYDAENLYERQKMTVQTKDRVVLVQAPPAYGKSWWFIALVGVTGGFATVRIATGDKGIFTPVCIFQE